MDVCLEKSQGRSEVELGDCMASQVLVFGFVNMHETLAFTCVEFQLVHESSKCVKTQEIV